MKDIVTINGMDGYVENGMGYVNLRRAAMGLSFIKMERNGNIVMDTDRIKKYLNEIGVSIGDELPKYIPVYLFYKLAAKATSSSARIFTDNMKKKIVPQIMLH